MKYILMILVLGFRFQSFACMDPMIKNSAAGSCYQALAAPGEGPKASVTSLYIEDSALQNGKKVEMHFTFVCSDNAVWIATAKFEYNGEYNKDVYFGTVDAKKCGAQSAITSNQAKQLK